VHAECETMTRELVRECALEGRIGVSDLMDSRPIADEVEAVRSALDIAGETGCALHVAHVSCGAVISLITAASKAGVDVSCETSPHYLVLTEEDAERIGEAASCAPPLRSGAARDSLWQFLRADRINSVGSDHYPAPPSSQAGASWFQNWGGISGAQHTLPLLLTEGCVNRGVTSTLIAKLTALNVAERFNLPPTKGRIAPEADADIAIVDLEASFVVAESDLFHRPRRSPYLGRILRGRVMRTILRGRTVFKDGQIVAEPLGQLVTPVDWVANHV